MIASVQSCGEKDIEDGVLAATQHRNADLVTDLHQPFPDGRSRSVHLLVGALFAHHSQGGQSGGTGDRVAVEGADLVDISFIVGRSPVVDRKDVGPAQDCREGVAAAHDLAHGTHVWRDAVELLSTAVGQPEAGYDFAQEFYGVTPAM